jgi:hypothetical protein
MKLVDLGMSNDYRPDLPRDEAEQAARKLIAKGCVICGTTEQNTEVWTEEGEQVTTWYPVPDPDQPWEQRVCCVACYLLIKTRASKIQKER